IFIFMLFSIMAFSLSITLLLIEFKNCFKKDKAASVIFIYFWTVAASSPKLVFNAPASIGLVAPLIIIYLLKIFKLLILMHQ
ncbi:hypothetical protein, partial [Mycoplasmopsis bovis]|uniref:hypothetical protein n=1 Tax=Mycoplasmopsis bovis TaxID=28903 RepID=UPI003D2A75C4